MDNSTLKSERNDSAAAKFDPPASHFNLESSRWYSLMKCGLACRNAKVDAEAIIKWARNLGSFEYEPTIGTALAEAENETTEALFAIKTARAEYERITNTKLVAAE